ncbi:MAG: hypothetical protein A2644_00665 [Candidatus Zambryskibacteria bacterium RIFCSPHIGHO2_01_FULL_39_63]|nr:MAG: hypothetical protein A2644_00665 [Candidatus Zambryskibacteria bacterium RIFCSPHIGHO2_01_FULL_39_63]OHA95120.1 MAG: hypothetical protein A3B88_02695 [Candidatus Zambryskibacteria bacterium RIFCSPHIGHO2_02_FULL_39_19]OHA98668.1 MAG: hypothetical protein A3F20_00235 [Candidatus Zambryskibacteria bacterium RIFCSPHIGHO2_12_FULL_39_21]
MKINRGFSLVEVVVASAIFATVAISIYQSFISITSLISASRDKVSAIDLINSEFELIRNLTYGDVGLQGGIPNGVLLATSTVVKDGREFDITRVIRNIDDSFDGIIGSLPNDLSPADYKMVQISISCNSCKNPLDFSAVSNISPKNLETASTNGALFIKVFNANGDPLPLANVHIENASLGVDINETTDNDGLLAIVDAPPAQNSYKITVSKNGFTTDRTYATTTYPNPLKPEATVLLQQVTQISFVIDRVSDISLRTITNTCLPVPDVPFAISGTKLVATAPDVYKWSLSNPSTDALGIKNIANVEWDVYSFTTSPGFYLAGTNPISPISILPNSSQNVDLIMTNDSPAFILVNVKDGSTGLPISGASVSIGSQTLVTDQGYLRQTDWSGGSGQLNFTDASSFFSSDGNVEINNPAGELKLLESLGNFVPSGELTSSIFDTGTSSNWSRVDILPTDQPPLAGLNSVRFLIATSEDNTATTTWDFLGPDGTVGNFSNNFYTITNNNINPIHNGDRYIRYKIFLSTIDDSFSPNVSDFVISFSSFCIPPGQVLFSNLTEPQDYTLEVQATGYTTQIINPVSVNSSWVNQDVSLSP